MRRTVYSTDIAEVYTEAIVGDVHVFIINPDREAELPPWLRSELWDTMGRLIEHPQTPVRQKTHDAEIIHIDDLRARRMGTWREGRA